MEENVTGIKSKIKGWSIKLLWTGFIGGSLFITLLFIAISNWEVLGKLPEIEELENPKTQLATEILSADGEVLGTIFRENRSISTYKELSPHLVHALVSTEDERYYEHSGIDAQAVARAVIKLGKDGGGSTITQQLAKMLFTGNYTQDFIERVGQKLNEWVIAVQLERQYTKEEIIAMYFNKLDFVNNAAGIKSAARIYFNKFPDELNVQQAAMLVGMAKAPSTYNPVQNPEKSRLRRNVVLYQMVKNEHLTKEEFDSLQVLPLGLEFNRASHQTGIATYFREEVRSRLKEIFSEIRKSDGSEYDIYRDGLKVYTTLNYNMQRYAERAVKKHLSEELQPDFFEHWSKKPAYLKKYAPFYFEDMTAEEKEGMVESLVLSGIRNSPRYKRVLESKPELKDRTYTYNRAYYEMTQLENKLSGADNLRFQNQQTLNRLNKDTTNARFILEQKEEVRNRIEDIQDSINDIKEEIADLRPSYEEKKEVYLKLWQPFDDSMQVVFKKPRKMQVFTWNGTKDTVLSPRDSVIHHKWFLRSGMMSIDPKTGHIKAWVGGINYKFFQYDHVRARRQVGSTFKPFVYATAIENGMNPCDKIMNQQVTIPKGMYGLEEAWTPKNAGGESHLDGEPLSLKMALANSINSVTARIMKDFGPLAVIDIARRCGITSNIQPVPSICLGTPDLSLYEMVSAYSVFANKGIWIKPSFILRIEDKNGSVIWTPKPERREAMAEENAYKMLELLGGVAAYGPKVNGKSTYGTGIRLRFSRHEYGNIPFNVKIAGKTGTTQNQSDGWFMGITPDLVTGVWTGCEDRAAHFLSLRLGMGTNMALPIWGYYMNSIYKDKEIKISKGDFEKPESLEGVSFDCTDQNAKSDDNWNTPGGMFNMR